MNMNWRVAGLLWGKFHSGSDTIYQQFSPGITGEIKSTPAIAIKRLVGATSSRQIRIANL